MGEGGEDRGRKKRGGVGETRGLTRSWRSSFVLQIDTPHENELVTGWPDAWMHPAATMRSKPIFRPAEPHLTQV